MSSAYQFYCPHCHKEPADRLEDLYGKIPLIDFKAKQEEITEDELNNYPTLMADTSLILKDGRLIVQASCCCTRCGARCEIDASNQIFPGDKDK